MELDGAWDAAQPHIMDAVRRLCEFDRDAERDAAVLRRLLARRSPPIPVTTEKWERERKKPHSKPGSGSLVCGFAAHPSTRRVGLHITLDASPGAGAVEGRRLHFTTGRLIGYRNEKAGNPSEFDPRMFHARIFAVEATLLDPADGFPPPRSARSAHITLCCYGVSLPTEDGRTDTRGGAGGAHRSARKTKKER